MRKVIIIGIFAPKSFENELEYKKHEKSIDFIGICRIGDE